MKRILIPVVAVVLCALAAVFFLTRGSDPATATAETSATATPAPEDGTVPVATPRRRGRTRGRTARDRL